MSIAVLGGVDGAKNVARVLPPLRRRVLAALREPDSATGLARRLGMSRQKLNYHLRELERAGLVELAEEVPRRGCVERKLRARADAVLIDPDLLRSLPEPDAIAQDRFSSDALLALSAGVIRDVATLRRRADRAGERLATLSFDAVCAFASPAELRAFAEELGGAIAGLLARYHKPEAAGARPFRLVAGAHPKITKSEEEAT